MSVALFQGLDFSSYAQLEYNLRSSRVNIVGTGIVGSLWYCNFSKAPAQMYWKGLELSEMFGGALTFLGIDSGVPTDKYNLSIINRDVPGVETVQGRQARMMLIDYFMQVTKQAPIDGNWLYRICRQSVLGHDIRGSSGYTYQALQMCIQSGYSCDYRRLLGSENRAQYSDAGKSTLVNAMAHLCYLFEIDAQVVQQPPTHQVGTRLSGMFK